MIERKMKISLSTHRWTWLSREARRSIPSGVAACSKWPRKTLLTQITFLSSTLGEERITFLSFTPIKASFTHTTLKQSKTQLKLSNI